MTVATLFREIFLWLTMKDKLFTPRNSEDGQFGEHGSLDAEGSDPTDLPSETPKQLPDESKNRPFYEAEIRHAPPPAPVRTEEVSEEKAAPAPAAVRPAISQEDPERIAVLTAERIAAIRRDDPEEKALSQDRSTSVENHPQTPTIFQDDRELLADLRQDEPEGKTLPQDRQIFEENHPQNPVVRMSISQDDLERIAALTAERITDSRRDEPEGNSLPHDRQIFAENDPQTPAMPMSISREDPERIAVLTAELIAARLFDSGAPEARNEEFSAKLDTILAAVKSNGEQLRRIAEDDGNTIFFS